MDNKDNQRRRFEGKVALVTGAATGIGRATARAFAREGAAVVVADVVEDEARQTVALITESGGRALFCKTDVSDEDACRNAVEFAEASFGRLDVAFNNAGIARSGTTMDLPVAEWTRTLAINLTGVMNCLKYEIPAMLRAGGGAIVNTSSVAGIRGLADSGAYCAAKHGVIGLTRAVALDHASQGIRVNALCPGVTDTPMVQGMMAVMSTEQKEGVFDNIPNKRAADPDEMAKAVLFLTSDDASYVIGHALVVDAGLSIK